MSLNPAQIAVTEAIALGVKEELARFGKPLDSRFQVRAATLDDGGLSVHVHDTKDDSSVAGANIGRVEGFDMNLGLHFYSVGVDLATRKVKCTDF